MNEWPLNEPKNQLSRVVDLALREGPQRITCRGRAAVVVVAAEHYARLVGEKPSLEEMLLAAPDDVDLELIEWIGPRSKGRRIDLG
jgi:prevent-host-death family protein